MERVEINDITGDVLDAAVKIHRMFGPGLLESVYERILMIELVRRGHVVERQKSVSFEYEKVVFENAFRLDLLVDGKVVVELKSTPQLLPVYMKQVRTYLVLTGLQVGLVVNFGMDSLKDGFRRVVHQFDGKLPAMCRTLLSTTNERIVLPKDGSTCGAMQVLGTDSLMDDDLIDEAEDSQRVNYDQVFEALGW